MARNFSNFLDAYISYASDEFCPPQFHLWTGISIIAAALERKVWVKQGHIHTYPNIYTLLVSHPGVGKSTALDRGTDLIEEMKHKHNANFKIIPNQITEPALVDMMNTLEALQFGTTTVQYSSGYFHASEASASALQNLFGDFNATITALYDCPKFFRKKIKSENRTVEIPNACFNVLAGSTFDYLKKLVNEESVMGGLASRFVYVLHKERQIRRPKWGETVELDLKKRNFLVNDLSCINRLKGQFTPTPKFIEAWEKWYPEFDQFLIDLDSSRVESLLARKGTNLMKVCMVLSAAEGDSLELDIRHWNRAVEIIEEVTKDVHHVISQAMMADVDSQIGLYQIIMQTIKKGSGKVNIVKLRNAAMRHGTDPMKFEQGLKFLTEGGKIKTFQNGSITMVELLVDANTGL